MGKNPARNPKVTRRTRTTKAGPKGSVRRASPSKPSRSSTPKKR